MEPHDRQLAPSGNGTMIGLIVQTPEQVDAVYNKAIELGAQCEDPAGFRGKRFYAGYFRDPDGNKLNAFCRMNADKAE